MKTMLIRTALAATLLAALPLAATAVTASPTATPPAQTQRLTTLKTKGTAEIDRRLASLQAALDKLTAAIKLTATDKATLTKQVQAEITSLTNLKAKLAADTDLATARTDVQSIVTDYRVYALMLPKARMTASADRFAVVEDKLTQLHDKLQARLKAQTNPPATAQAKLDDMKAKIADAKAKSDSLVAKLLTLQPTDYNANHAVLVDYRASLKAAHDDLKTARDDAKAVIDLLKTTPSVKASPSTSPAAK